MFIFSLLFLFDEVHHLSCQNQIRSADRKVFGLSRGGHGETGEKPHMHQAKTAGRGLQPRPKRLFSGVGKYFGRGCKPRPADRAVTGRTRRDRGETRLFSAGESAPSRKKSRVSLPHRAQSENFSIC
ncbi:Uncharacterized protein dnm_031340 [Desulfonema magnum]|uniref:Uncharacterized protein n=1 Tax=Desulfonema magnum TaxID=45655 RepID=A0A975BKD2_9BACT|nr:Uncharacterized protein dnm_031340 [Desulfonema magnum]